MSVLASKKVNRAQDILGESMKLYKSAAQVVLDKEIVPPQLNSEFRYPILTNLRDMCANVAIAMECSPIKDFNRRSKRLMDAHDNTIVFDTHLELLKMVRRVPDDTVVDLLTSNVKIQRSIKATMAEDRILLDDHHRSKRHKDAAKKDNDANLVETEPKEDDQLILPESSKDSSIKELRKRALENTPELAGIVNNPTDPESPVLDRVREIQQIKSDAIDAQIRKGRVRRSSH